MLFTLLAMLLECVGMEAIQFTGIVVEFDDKYTRDYRQALIDTSCRHCLDDDQRVSFTMSRENGLSSIETFKFNPLKANTDCVLVGIKQNKQIITATTNTVIDARRLLRFRWLGDKLNGIKAVDVINLNEIRRNHADGKGVKIGIFDTGFHKTKYQGAEHVDMTNKSNRKQSFRCKVHLKDLDHGHQVASIITGRSKRYPGVATMTEIFMFRVFDCNMQSRISWFLEGMEAAMTKQLDVVLFSVGGDEFQNLIFEHKVDEMVTMGITVVVACGNKGPTFGSLTSPSNNLRVISVGSADHHRNRVAAYSSRGPTIEELPLGGYRVKPDVVAVGNLLLERFGRVEACRGTSFAAALVSGVLSLLISSWKTNNTEKDITPIVLRQILLESSTQLRYDNVFSQGAGLINVTKAYETMVAFQPHISSLPAFFDNSRRGPSGKYMRPWSLQRLRNDVMILNLTLLSSFDWNLCLHVGQVSFEPNKRKLVGRLKVEVIDNQRCCLHNSACALGLQLRSVGDSGNALIRGKIMLFFGHSNGSSVEPLHHHLKFPVNVELGTMLSREHNVVFDSYHSSRESSLIGNLEGKYSGACSQKSTDVFTGFFGVYRRLSRKGKHVYRWKKSMVELDPSLFGTFVIVSPVLNFSREEISTIQYNVMYRGMSLVIFADWQNSSVADRMLQSSNKERYRANDRCEAYIPGSCNVDTLNDLLDPFGVELSDRVYKGRMRWKGLKIRYQSGTSLKRYPQDDHSLIYSGMLEDQGSAFLSNHRLSSSSIPILLLRQLGGNNSGALVVYGDSTCLEESTHCINMASNLITWAAVKTSSKIALRRGGGIS